MKRIAARLIIGVFILLGLLLITSIAIKVGKANETAERIRKLPDFSFSTINRGLFNSGNIEKGPLLITYFHPECEHCQYEISSLFESNIHEGNMKLVLVSYAGCSQLRIFMQQFNYENDTLLWVLSDTSLSFGEIFGTEVIPSNFIYDENLELIKVLKGEIKTETILKYLRSAN